MITRKYRKITYYKLNARQKENYNFQKVSAVLADYGFITLRLNDDWQGADFIAQHIDGKTFLKIQLKARLTFDKKYLGKCLFIVFSEQNRWYLYPHADLFEIISKKSNIVESQSWKEKGLYHYPKIPDRYKELMDSYAL
ncbi:MAG: hypothetical protein M0Z70_02920 [Nitrospiraceae bacterium]|nr:hypothetical protein [Nitrospirota bacterium]MDA8338237.1 hypothetical protein [Nitrospiraceae bacterium]